jgi:hypothetical protein
MGRYSMPVSKCPYWIITVAPIATRTFFSNQGRDATIEHLTAVAQRYGSPDLSD